jgi:peroxiredoxin Q/BCP
MHHLGRRATVALLALIGAPLAAQQPAAPPPAPTPLAVGTEAPDFTLPAATMAGVSSTPVKLSDYRGRTVVLAFFFRARTKG